jgi:phage baseplate assembly protein W
MSQLLYYTLPLRFDELMQKRQHKRCNMKESIAQHIYLILTSHFGEKRYDPDFGCNIWEQDFEVVSNIKWKDNVKTSVTEAIERYERRLVNPSVRIEVDEFEFSHNENRRVKRRVALWIEGYTVKTNEPFEFYEQIFISPMSID